jgi:translation initiation factor IF-3
MNPRFDRRRPDQGLRVNHRIRVPEVRVLFEDQQLGVMPTYQALKLAEEKGLDLVEISPRAQPPVCRITDYGKYKYEEAKNKPKRAWTVEIKEIKFRPKTDEHDLDFKVKHVRRFIEEGNKVRLAVTFRGRENAHPETGKAVLDRVVERTQDISVVEVRPSLEGRGMAMMIAPKPDVLRKAQEAWKASLAKREEQKQHGEEPEDDEEESDEPDESSDAPAAQT